MDINFLGGVGEVTGSKYLVDGEIKGRSYRFLLIMECFKVVGRR